MENIFERFPTEFSINHKFLKRSYMDLKVTLEI